MPPGPFDRLRAGSSTGLRPRSKPKKRAHAVSPYVPKILKLVQLSSRENTAYMP